LTIRMHWQDGGQIQRTLETVFNSILQQRMAGLPVLNPALSVQALDFQSYSDNWAGILITPWFMNLLLLPKAEADWQALGSGEKIRRRFPHGEFEFIVAVEQALGCYAACSLYSPMFQFDRQAVAVATAHAAWQALFIDSEAAEALAKGSAPQTISRRDLLRGAIGSRKNKP